MFGFFWFGVEIWSWLSRNSDSTPIFCCITNDFLIDSFWIQLNCCGYYVSIIDEKEHNNQIVPELFYEIDHSQFLVVDITYPNNDAYFETGYAVSADDILPLRGNECIAAENKR